MGGREEEMEVRDRERYTEGRLEPFGQASKGNVISKLN
jgi:hypothetical protein